MRLGCTADDGYNLAPATDTYVDALEKNLENCYNTESCFITDNEPVEVNTITPNSVASLNNPGWSRDDGVTVPVVQVVNMVWDYMEDFPREDTNSMCTNSTLCSGEVNFENLGEDLANALSSEIHSCVSVSGTDDDMCSSRIDESGTYPIFKKIYDRQPL